MTDARIVGWIEHERFIEEHTSVNFGYGPRVAVSQSQLHEIDRLFDVSDEQIELHAQAWIRNKIENHITDMRYDKAQTSADVDRLGICGELAVAEWLGVPFPVQTYLRGDPGFDLTSQTGRTVSIKATRKPHGMLFFNTLEKFLADVAVLVVVGS